VNKNPNKENLKPFKKGVDERRNLDGRPPKLPQLDVLMGIVLGEEKDGITAAEAILKALRMKASKGDVRAAEVLLDRAYGKAKQVNEVTIKEPKLPEWFEDGSQP
jgi:hypothetical protein